MSIRVVKLKHIGVPQSSRDAFTLLADAQIIPQNLCKSLQSMVGFRNIAVHDYQRLNLDIVRAIIENRLADLTALSQTLLALEIE